MNPFSRERVGTNELTSYTLRPNEYAFKHTHSENTLTNKTQTLMKSMNMNIWVIGTLNQLFKRDSYTQIIFSKK